MRSRNVRRALLLDKRITRWISWQAKCKLRVKELKFERKSFIEDMPWEDLVIYCDIAGETIPQKKKMNKN